MPYKKFDGEWSTGTMTQSLPTLPPIPPMTKLVMNSYPNLAERIVRVMRDLLAIVALALASTIMIAILMTLSAVSERVHVG